MINSKFKCGDKVWFMNLDSPISKFVYEINKTRYGIWYVLTDTIGFYSTDPICVDEKNLYKSYKELNK